MREYMTIIWTDLLDLLNYFTVKMGQQWMIPATLYFDLGKKNEITATILAKIMWTPNFSNANINIETFFHEICRPLPLFNVVSRI